VAAGTQSQKASIEAVCLYNKKESSFLVVKAHSLILLHSLALLHRPKSMHTVAKEAADSVPAVSKRARSQTLAMFVCSYRFSAFVQLLVCVVNIIGL
jgi:hypothetical protein